MTFSNLITVPILLLLMFVISNYEKPDEKLDSIDDKNNNMNSTQIKTTKFKWITIILMTICLASMNTLEIVYFNLGATYLQYSPIKLSASTAASVISCMTAGYTIGQAVNFFTAMVVKTEHIICYHFLLSFAAFVSLIFAQNNENWLWIVNTVIGLAISALFPGLMSFFGNFIKITDRISTFMWCSIGVINFIPPVIFGIFIEQFPSIFIIIEIILLTLSLFSIILFIIFKRKYL